MNAKRDKKLRELEHDHQVALFAWAAYDKRPELKLMYAVPNGGLRNKAVAGKLKAEGVKAGVPDIVLPVARGGFHSLYIELKVGKNTVKANQRDWLDRLHGAGNMAVVCYGWDKAQKVIEGYLGLKEG
ncbi:VRR-NUC domain-containing protein [Candidatus Pacearchaeota archaeon]|nr:VRR-NUC domain-containing protein [Candidatus Pacearchaeota archaeon]